MLINSREHLFFYCDPIYYKNNSQKYNQKIPRLLEILFAFFDISDHIVYITREYILALIAHV